MSSPDPLNESDATQTHLLSSTRRITRSQLSQRLRSVESSPKKQTFALDIGNDISPQRILVTVQTEDADNAAASSVKRRLFQSPTPKRSTRKRTAVTAGTTTTTVPLRGLSDDEGASTSTPRARGRPRKQPTPGPTTARRRKGGTPLAQKVLTQARATRSSSVLVSDLSETDSQATPRATRAKRPAKRKASSPVKEDSVSGSQPRKRGRPRKQPAASSDLGSLPEQESAADAEVEDNISVAQVGDNIRIAGNPADVAPSEADEDIWLATLSDQPTPLARRSTRRDESFNIPEPAPKPAPEQHQPEAAVFDAGYDAGGDDGGYADFGGMGSHSDVESSIDDRQDAQERSDTVAAGEDFTMINLGSLSSMMQLNSSMMGAGPPLAPLAPQEEPESELGDETSLIINGALESLRQSQRAGQPAAEEPLGPEQSFDRSVLGNSIMQQRPPHLALQAPSSHTTDRSPVRTAKPQSLGKQVALKALREVAAGSPERAAGLDIPEAHETSAYDDSFSEIPEYVLTAATPGRQRSTQANAEEDTPKPDIQPSIERPSTVNHSNPQSESNRLLTPDETPSPVVSENGDHEEQKSSPAADPEPEMNSSPPLPSLPVQGQFRGSVIQHARAQSTETPAEQVAAIKSTAVHAPVVSLLPHEPPFRPTLSPIVRAGRALQLVTSDPPSPPGRDSVLRSPFRGSVPSVSPAPQAAQATQSPPQAQAQAHVPARQPERSWMSPLHRVKDLVVQGAQALSPRLGSVARMDDPFAPNPAESPKPAAAGSFLASLGRKDGASMLASSTRGTSLFGNDAMSWKDVNSPARDPPRQQTASRESSIDASRGSPARDAEVKDAQDKGDNGLAESDVEMEDYGEESQAGSEEQEMQDQDHRMEEEEEEDIWAIEARRPTPGRARALQPERGLAAEPPRRSKIPSPWRQSSRRLASNDELQDIAEENSHQSEPEEFSLLSQQTKPRPQPALPKAPPPKHVDLSQFFSSPTTLPDADGAGFGLFKALDAPRETSRNPPRPPPRFEEPASFGRSTREPVAEARPVNRSTQRFGTGSTSLSSARQTPAVEEEIDQVPFQRGRNLLDFHNAFPSAKKPTVRLNPPDPHAAAAPPQVNFAHVPQKVNFTPRARKSGPGSLFSVPAAKSLFGPKPVPILSAAPEQDEHEESIMTSPEESSFIQPQLKPLPDRAMSPTKSCMRSPLKPKTPGRVVEFTSSTLSPLAQAQARAERRASASPEKQLGSSSGSGSSHSDSSLSDDKENQQSSSSDSSDRETVSASAPLRSTIAPNPRPRPQRPILAPPTSFTNTLGNTNPNPNTRPASPTKPQLRTQNLSRTEWTLDHWVRLDQLLQARKQGMLQFQLQLAHAPPAGARKRRSAEFQMLVGKTLEAQGEKMRMEEWHVDVVEAFRSEVGGWSAEDLARRLFAAMVGEERRKKGLVRRRR